MAAATAAAVEIIVAALVEGRHFFIERFWVEPVDEDGAREMALGVFSRAAHVEHHSEGVGGNFVAEFQGREQADSVGGGAGGAKSERRKEHHEQSFHFGD